MSSNNDGGAKVEGLESTGLKDVAAPNEALECSQSEDGTRGGARKSLFGASVGCLQAANGDGEEGEGAEEAHEAQHEAEPDGGAVVPKPKNGTSGEEDGIEEVDEAPKTDSSCGSKLVINEEEAMSEDGEEVGSVEGEKKSEGDEEGGESEDGQKEEDEESEDSDIDSEEGEKEYEEKEKRLQRELSESINFDSDDELFDEDGNLLAFVEKEPEGGDHAQNEEAGNDKPEAEQIYEEGVEGKAQKEGKEQSPEAEVAPEEEVTPEAEVAPEEEVTPEAEMAAEAGPSQEESNDQVEKKAEENLDEQKKEEKKVNQEGEKAGEEEPVKEAKLTDGEEPPEVDEPKEAETGEEVENEGGPQLEEGKNKDEEGKNEGGEDKMEGKAAVEEEIRDEKKDGEKVKESEEEQMEVDEEQDGEEDEPEGNEKESEKPTEEESPAVERRKSLRTPKSVNYYASPPKPASSAKKNSGGRSSVVRKLQQEHPETQNFRIVLEPLVMTPKKQASSLRRRMEEAGGPRRSATARIKPSANTRSLATDSRRNDSDPDDPFNLEANIDNHPQPLRNIQMERQSFGNIKYTKTPTPSTPTNRYEKTEQTASERRSNLGGLGTPTKHGVQHKSLSELSTVRTSSRKTGRVSIRAQLMELDPAENEASGSTPKGKKKTVVKAETAPIAQTRKRRRGAEASVERAKKAKPTVPKLDADEQYAVDHRENEHAAYEVGSRVYGLWGRDYFAAKISAERDSSGRYELLFVEDEMVRRLVGTGLFSITALAVGKECVTSKRRDGEDVMEDVQILAVPSDTDNEDWLKAVYRVKSIEHGDEYDVSWEKLQISQNQAVDFVTAKVNTVCDVMADNIDSADSRRTRARRHAHAVEDATPVRASKPAKRTKTEPKAERSVAKLKNEVGVSARPQLNRGIFDGIAVVVTSAMRKNKDEEQDFSKREVRQMIEGHGGMVADDFDKVTTGEKVLLIADTYYRTHKYLSALARCVPCVRHQWVRACVEQKKLLDFHDYMLPAGASILTNKLVSWHANSSKLLGGKRVMIWTQHLYPPSMTTGFGEVWTPLIEQMGATVLSEMPKEGLDVLLTDSTCTDEVLAQARALKAMVVSSEWIIQSIIHGCLPGPLENERFRHNYTDVRI